MRATGTVCDLNAKGGGRIRPDTGGQSIAFMSHDACDGLRLWQHVSYLVNHPRQRYAKNVQAADDQSPGDTGNLTSVTALAKLSGCSAPNLTVMASRGTIPPAGWINGRPLFDLQDERLAAWLKALQAAGIAGR